MPKRSNTTNQANSWSRHLLPGASSRERDAITATSVDQPRRCQSLTDRAGYATLRAQIAAGLRPSPRIGSWISRREIQLPVGRPRWCTAHGRARAWRLVRSCYGRIGDDCLTGQTMDHCRRDHGCVDPGYRSLCRRRAAALPPELQQTAHAMHAVHSYKLTEDVTSSGAAAGSPLANAHIEVVFVSRGAVEQSHLTIEVKAGQTSQTLLEVVTTPNRSCARGLLFAMFSTGKSDPQKWDCGKDAKSAGSSAPNGSTILRALGGFTLHPLGRRALQGQLCDGFTVAKHTKGDSQAGQLWISAASHLPIEVDLLEVKVDASGKKSSDKSETVFSNYNDPALTVPTVE